MISEVYHRMLLEMTHPIPEIPIVTNSQVVGECTRDTFEGIGWPVNRSNLKTGVSGELGDIWVRFFHQIFWNLTPLVSYYKIWPFTMFFRKFQDVWWKNRSHTSHSSQETRVLRFDRLLPVNRSSGSWEKTFSQVSTLWLLDTIRIFKIGWTVFENIRCNCWLIKTYISPKEVASTIQRIWYFNLRSKNEFQ